jgi:hypothetical protein
LDIEGIAKSPIELGSLDLVEVAHRGRIENALRNCEDIVVTLANLDLRAKCRGSTG